MARSLEKFRASLELQLSDPERHTFTGLASVFGNLVEPQPPAMMPTFIMPRAFNKTLKDREGRIKIKLMHQDIIGKLLSGYEAEMGLQITGMISDTTNGRDTRTLMLDKVLTELSIGFEAVPSGVEYLTGRQLIERLASMNINYEIASLIKTKIDEYGAAERYRVINEIKLYEVSIVDEGADDMTQITDVNMKIHLAAPELHKIVKRGNQWCLLSKDGSKTLGCHDTKQEAIDQEIAVTKAQSKQSDLLKKMETAGAMTMDEIMAYVHDLLQAMADMSGDYAGTNADGEPAADMSSYNMYACSMQIKSICSAVITMLEMPAMIPEAMQSQSTGAELRAGRKISAARMGVLKDHMKSLKSMYKILKGLIDSAEPPADGEKDFKQPALAEPPAPAREALLIERRQKIRDLKLRYYLNLSGVNDVKSIDSGAGAVKENNL